ncbi:hypothetical protein PRIPAC_84109 [Pristionchus pacificus]|uniref:GLTP domain-containing protein n=1 Tax=Pristionchus pacificus TaxID=54126 RepID=A0A2A6BRL0_PRIPA|nr:hypothetical protein PRIPAC_84109 [Pristionchus pacificus]|eukprot:PDM68592.1 hypothetical protein PRIPAC_46894 [Pristionchus pacificus]
MWISHRLKELPFEISDEDMTFDRDDPKYIYCHLHITTLARISIAVSIVGTALDLWGMTSLGDFYHVIGIPIVLLGIYGVFREQLGPLISFVVCNMIYFIFLLSSFISTDDESDDYVTTTTSATSRADYELATWLFFGFCGAILIPSIWINCNLAKYIKDREWAEMDTLARFQMVVTIATSLFVPYQAISCEDYWNLIWIPIVIFGAYGVFREVRTPLLIYIILFIMSGISSAIQVAFYVTKNRHAFSNIIPITIISGLLFVAIMTFNCMTLWVLIKFIKDRKAADQVPQHLQKAWAAAEAKPLRSPRYSPTLMIMPTIPMGLDIPPGLEYLFTIGSAHVQQMTTNIDTPNKYMIYNDQGHFIYFAQEVQTGGEFVAAQMVGDSRGFRIRVTDAMGRTVFTVFRSSKLWTNCEMIVEAPPGTPCGYASFQSNILCRGVMTIMDQFRRPILTIPFPSERDAHLSDRGYPLMMGGLLVGAIVRKFPGFAKQIMTNCDNFAITFPAELEPRVKCVLLACAILIDFIDFEDKRDVTRGKNKNVSPQARASLGNPFQASVNVVPVATVTPMYGGGCGIGNIPAARPTTPTTSGGSKSLGAARNTPQKSKVAKIVIIIDIIRMFLTLRLMILVPSVMTCAAPANNHTDFAKKEHLFPCLQEDSGIPTEPFLSAFQGLADFVGFMGTAFAPVKSDIAGNVRTRWLKDPIGQDTLQKLIASDLKDNGGKLGIATEGLLWLKRGQEFMLLMLIFMVRDYRKDKASTESLVSYSKWPTMADPVVEDQSSSSQDEVLQIKTLTKKHIQVLYRLLILIVDNFGGGRKDLFGCEGGRREGTSTAEGRKEEREGGGWKERGVEECEEKRLEGPMGGEEKKIASTAFYIFMGSVFGNSRTYRFTTTCAHNNKYFFSQYQNDSETLIVNTIFAIVSICIEIPFIATYWALAKFIRDRELATPRVGYVVYQQALMTVFNYFDSKYQSCCCGVHVTKVAGVLIVIDFIRLILMGKFFLLVPIVIVCLGAYGVIAENRLSLIIYVILTVVSTILMTIALLIVMYSEVFFKDYYNRRHFRISASIVIKVILYGIYLGSDIPFIMTYWKLAKFIKDRDMAPPPVGYHTTVIYQHV